MPHSRPIAIVLAGLTSLALPGCLAFYSTRPVEVVVTRAETGQPAANVPVRVEYLYMGILNPPEPAQGTTDAKGSVVLPMADFDLISLHAAGTKFFLGADEVRKGGTLEKGMQEIFKKNEPPVSIKLIPRKCSL